MRMKNYLPMLVAGIVMTSCSPSQAKEGITEAQIRAHMDEQGDAIRRFDPETVCNAYTDDFNQVDHTEFTGGEKHTERYDKAKGCDSARKSAEALRLADAKGLKLAFTDTIENISIAPDGKSATVRYRSVSTLNGRPFLNGVSTDYLVLVNGKILDRGGEGKHRVDTAALDSLR